MTRQAFISSGAFPSRKLADIFSIAEDWGISEIELSSDIAHDPENVAVARHGRKNFKILLHNYFPAPAQPFVLNLGSTNPESLERSRGHCRRALELSVEMQSTVFAAHAGFAANLTPGQLGVGVDAATATSREQAYSIFVDSVGGLVRYGQQLGVRFLVENNVVTRGNLVDGANRYLLLAEPDEILKCARDVGNGFGMLIDTGHLKVSSQSLNFDPVSAMRLVAGCTAAYHVSDNDGLVDNNMPFASDAWFLSLLIKDLPLTIEVYKASKQGIFAMKNLLHGSRK